MQESKKKTHEANVVQLRKRHVFRGREQARGEACACQMAKGINKDALKNRGEGHVRT